MIIRIINHVTYVAVWYIITKSLIVEEREQIIG